MDVGSGNSPPTRQKSLLLNRPFSSNGKPESLGGQISMVGDGSIIPVDYFLEALPGECLLVARVIIHIHAASQNLLADGYGDLPTLTNGIQLFYKRYIPDLNTFIVFDISNGLPIKTHNDWDRWCYDGTPVGPYGAASKTPFFRVRWTFTKYGTPWGVPLFEGERLGIRLNDDLEGLEDHTCVAEGVHLGRPSPFWTLLL